MDQDKPCPHEDFDVLVEVNRIVDEADSSVMKALIADIKVTCTTCAEKFRWTGAPTGMSFDEPRVSVDGLELHAPLRPASGDPDFGLGLPGFTVRQVT